MTIKELKDMIRILEEKNYDDECEVYVWDEYKGESFPIKDFDYDDNGFIIYLVI